MQSKGDLSFFLVSFLDSRLEIIFRVFRDFRGLKELLRLKLPAANLSLALQDHRE